MWYNSYWGSIDPAKMSDIKPSKLAAMKNSDEFLNHFEKFFLLAENQFIWGGLPDTCDARFLERCLLLGGVAMIAKEGDSYICLGSLAGGTYNLYGYPLTAYGWGLNGWNKEYSLYVPGADDAPALAETAGGYRMAITPQAVQCWDNDDRYPYVRYIFTAAQRLSDLIRATDVAAQGLKSPYLITCDESQKSTVEAALKKRANNETAIIASKMSLSADMFKVWPTTVSDQTLKALWTQYTNIEASLLDTLGIVNNPQSDKRERLLVDEVNSNNEETGHNLDKRLKQRQLFAERLNKCFGLNVSVEPRGGEMYGEPDDADRMDSDEYGDESLDRDDD